MTPGWPRGAWSPTFLCSKNKKLKQRKKERVSKQKLFKDCHQGQNVTERLEFKYFLMFHGHSTLKSILPALPNLALISAALHRKRISLRCVLGGIFLSVLLLAMTQFFSSFFFCLFEKCKKKNKKQKKTYKNKMNVEKKTTNKPHSHSI